MTIEERDNFWSQVMDSMNNFFLMGYESDTIILSQKTKDEMNMKGSVNLKPIIVNEFPYGLAIIVDSKAHTSQAVSVLHLNEGRMEGT